MVSDCLFVSALLRLCLMVKGYLLCEECVDCYIFILVGLYNQVHSFVSVLGHEEEIVGNFADGMETFTLGRWCRKQQRVCDIMSF